MRSKNIIYGNTSENMQTLVGRPKVQPLIYFANIRRVPLLWVPSSCNHGPIGCCIYPDDNDVEVVRKCESYLACALDADMLRGPTPLQPLSLLLA